MKKILYWFSIIILSIVFIISCGTDEEDEGESATPVANTTTYLKVPVIKVKSSSSAASIRAAAEGEDDIDNEVDEFMDEQNESSDDTIMQINHFNAQIDGIYKEINEILEVAKIEEGSGNVSKDIVADGDTFRITYTAGTSDAPSIIEVAGEGIIYKGLWTGDESTGTVYVYLSFPSEKDPKILDSGVFFAEKSSDKFNIQYLYDIPELLTVHGYFDISDVAGDGSLDLTISQYDIVEEDGGVPHSMYHEEYNLSSNQPNFVLLGFRSVGSPYDWAIPCVGGNVACDTLQNSFNAVGATDDLAAGKSIYVSANNFDLSDKTEDSATDTVIKRFFK